MQIDGSNHPWLEDRGTKLTLLIAVDDATSTVVQAAFRTTEDTRGYLNQSQGGMYIEVAMMICWVALVNRSLPYLENDPAP